jgi:peptidylprolyl isomerase
LMKLVVCLTITVGSLIAAAQTVPPPASSKPTRSSSPTNSAGAVKLPADIPRARGPVKTAFSLRYQDIKIGTGPEAEPNKIYKVLYTGWIAADGRKFDSSEDHRLPLRDKDGKPVMGDDGKPELGDPQPFAFAQGFGRVMPGFDQGFTGMKVGGKRRLFIPWQMAYGARGRPGPDAAHPGIPPKADLIFDVELLDVSEMQMPANRPFANPVRPGAALPPGHQPMNPAAPAAPRAPASGAQPATPGTAPQATPPPAAKPATPASPPQTEPQSK